MTRQLILAFTGQNANFALDHSTRTTARFFEDYGFDTALIDLNQPDFSQEIMRQVRERRPAFAFGLAGVGASLSHQGVNLWSILKIPFLSMLFDHPCYIPERHKVDSSYVANCYYCRDFYDVQYRHIKSIQPRYLLTPDFPDADPAHLRPWAERDIDFLFLKTGGDPNKFLEGWQKNLPAPLCEMLMACAKNLRSSRHLDIADLVQARMAALPEEILAIDGIFWKMVRTLDDYIRQWRADRMVHVLKYLPNAVIIGNGWEHVDRTETHAVFRPSVSAAEAATLYGRSRIVANTNPYFRFGIHERMINGLYAGANVFTDRNTISDMWFKNIPSLYGFEWDTPNPNLRGRCRWLLAQRDPTDAQEETRGILRQRLRGQPLIGPILSIVAELEAQRFTDQDPPWTRPKPAPMVTP